MLKKWCDVTSCNGIVDLYNAKESSKTFIFWTCIMIIMFGCTGYFTYVTLMFYISTPSVTNMATIHENLMDLPDVLICYRGGLNYTTMLAYNFSVPLMKCLSTPVESFNSVQCPEQLKTEMNEYLADTNFTVYDLYRRFRIGCPEMVGMLKIPDAGPEILNSVTMCNTATYVPSINGACYVFKNNGHQYYPHAHGGMLFKLTEVKNDWHQVFTRSDDLAFTLQNDFTISLEKTFGQQISGRELIIPLNSIVFVTLNVKIYSRLSKFGACHDDVHYFTSNTCFYDCYQKEVVQSCGCMDMGVVDRETYPGVDVCDPFSLHECNFSFQIIHACEAKCLPKCEEWVFDSTVTSSTMDVYSGQPRISLLYIAYNSMAYTKIVEVEAFTLDMAVANVGGQFGLFLGASFVTIIQAFFYLCVAMYKRKR